MPGDPRNEPVEVKVLLTSGEGVAIDWRDSHHSRYSFPYLRQKCPCATCRERRNQGQDVHEGKVRSDLPLYHAPVKAVSAEAVGNYAVRFDFSDGHRTGIYSFDYFRRICPCAECVAASKGEEE